jgi:hypothetical protein
MFKPTLRIRRFENGVRWEWSTAQTKNFIVEITQRGLGPDHKY